MHKWDPHIIPAAISCGVLALAASLILTIAIIIAAILLFWKRKGFIHISRQTTPSNKIWIFGGDENQRAGSSLVAVISDAVNLN